MAQPITWRTVTGASPADAARPLALGAQQLNYGFENLQKLVSGAEDNDRKNWENMKQVNTQNFLDQLATAKTPEELAAMQQAGTLAQLRQGFGNQVDRSAIRSAEENRLNTVRQNVLAGQEYGDKQLDRAQLGTVEQIRALAAQGKTAEAQALFDANPDLRNKGMLMEKVVTGERAGKEFQFKVNDDTRKGEMHAWTGTKMADDLVTAAAQRAQMAAAAQASRASAHLSGVRAKGEGMENDAKALALAEKKEEQQYVRAFDAYIFQHQAKVADAKAKGLPTDTLPSDSEALRNAALEVGKVLGNNLNPTILNRVVAAKAEGFDAGAGMNATIGRDQRALVAEKEKQAARDKYLLENSPGGTGALNPIRDVKEVTEFINTIMGKESTKPKDALRGAVSRVINEGYELKGGKKIPVTKDILMAAINEVKDDRTWLGKMFNNEGSADTLFKNALDRLMENEAVTEGMQSRQRIDNSLPDRAADAARFITGKPAPKKDKKDK